MVLEQLVSAYDLLTGTVQLWVAMFGFIQIYIYLTLFSLVIWGVLKIPHIIVIYLGGWAERFVYGWRTKQTVFTDRAIFEATKTDRYAQFVREIRKSVTNWVRVSTKVTTYAIIVSLHGGMTIMMFYLIVAAEAGTSAALSFQTLAFDLITNFPVILLAALSFLFLYGCVTLVTLAFKVAEYSMVRKNAFSDLRYSDLLRGE